MLLHLVSSVPITEPNTNRYIPAAVEWGLRTAYGRGSTRPEDQDHPALGATWHQAERAPGSAHQVRLHLRCHLPRPRQGSRPRPKCNTDAMQRHLDEIALAVEPGAHALVMLDQAGWHTTDKLILPDNITLLPLPPKAPELNPAENVWQFMRENWLSNRIFQSYDEILQHCCDAWNKLVDQPWCIMSLGLRQWAHRF